MNRRGSDGRQQVPTGFVRAQDEGLSGGARCSVDEVPQVRERADVDVAPRGAVHRSDEVLEVRSPVSEPNAVRAVSVTSGPKDYRAYRADYRDERIAKLEERLSKANEEIGALKAEIEWLRKKRG
jgi:hypothetical protein